MQQRAALQPMLTAGSSTYTHFGNDKAFEMTVVEANFGFWQYTSPDDASPM